MNKTMLPKLKLSLMLLAGSTFAGTAHGQVYPQFIEIVNNAPMSCQCLNALETESETAYLNDDSIGDRAISRFGCDCAAHRRVIANTLQEQINLNQQLP